jgi:galactokinase
MRAQAYAPGRVELLGNHTDYNQGVVLAAAIDRGLKVSGQRQSGGVITLCSASLGQFEIRCGSIQPQREPRWVNYVLGVVRELLEAGVSIDGFSAEIEGDLPAGCGLASSAALELAIAFFH